MTVSRNRRPEFTELLKRLMPMIFAATGFIIGALVCAFFDGLKLLLPSPDMSSVFESEAPLYSAAVCVSSELKYAVLIYMLGFCTFGRMACLLAAAYRAFLAGLSAVYLLEAGYSPGLYFVHSAACLVIIALLCCMCRLSIEHSQRFVSGGERARREQILAYTVKCLFFAGLTVGVVIVRQLLLMFT